MSVSYGPAISTLPSLYEAQYVYGGFTEIRPRFIEMDDKDRESMRVLSVVKVIPAPETVSYTHPNLINFLQSTPQEEPVVSFRSFVQGVACAAALVPVEEHVAAEKALHMLAENVQIAQELPPLDIEYAEAFSRIEEKIFLNGEPMSWKNLIAFSRGMYWFLMYVRSPKKRRGKYSPASFAEALCIRSAELGFPPAS